MHRAFAGRYALPYAQSLLEKMMEQCLLYQPPSAEDIQPAELFGFYNRLRQWLEAELREKSAGSTGK